MNEECSAYKWDHCVHKRLTRLESLRKLKKNKENERKIEKRLKMEKQNKSRMNMNNASDWKIQSDLHENLSVHVII